MPIIKIIVNPLSASMERILAVAVFTRGSAKEVIGLVFEIFSKICRN
jgi:hypothetical protein